LHVPRRSPRLARRASCREARWRLLASPVGVAEEEGLVLNDRTADAEAELQIAERTDGRILRVRTGWRRKTRNASDQILIARLKRKKLYLRDQIAKIEDKIRPDIIA